jgi:threonine/homoserine/homoserine lactone efflux protein
MPSGIFAFILASVLMELTPGPNMTTLAILAATKGRLPGLAAMAGVASGLLLVGIAASFGMAVLIAQSPLLWNALRWGGALFLLWMAYDGWRGSESLAADLKAHDAQPGSVATTAMTALFVQGLMTNLLNPKAYLFYVAVLPRFIDDATLRPLAQSIMLTLIYVLIATIIHTAIVLAADRAGRLLASDQSATARKILSASLAVVALWLLWETRLAA